MLRNVNLNFVNLNTLTLCLSIYNRMAPHAALVVPHSWGGVRRPAPSTHLEWQRRRVSLAYFEAPHAHQGAPVGRALCAVHTACRLPRACPCCQPRSFAPWPSTTYCSCRQVRVHSLYVNFLVTNLRQLTVVLFLGGGLRPTRSTYLVARWPWRCRTWRLF